MPASRGRNKSKRSRRARPSSSPSRRSPLRRTPVPPAAVDLAPGMLAGAQPLLSALAEPTEEALRSMRRRATTNFGHTVDVLADAAVIPMDLLNAWTRFWTGWMQDVVALR